MLKMKTRKPKSITILICALALMLVMYNCKKKDDPLPDKPDEEITKELDDIKVAPVTITPPAPVESTEANVETSAKAGELNSGLGSITDANSIPASVTTAATEVTAAISESELNTLSNVDAALINAVKEGGEIPAEVKAALDHAASNPALQEYLPTFTLPTVNGTAVTGRTATSPNLVTPQQLAANESIEAVQDASDVCVAAAESAYQAKKTELDASKSAKDAEITAAYNAAIAPLAAEEEACKAGIPAKFAAYRAAIDEQVASALANLERVKPFIGPLYPILKALINIQALNAYAGLNNLEAASLAACTAKTAAATTNAQAARDANLAASQAAYDAALASAAEVRAKLIASCHNQGGGN